MRKFFFYLLAVTMLSINVMPASASFVKEKKNESTEVAPKTETGISALTIEQILSLTPKNYEELTGKKLSFKDKIGLKFVQRSIKRELKKTGTVNLKDYFQEDMPRFNIGGFALGFLLGLIGVGLAHIFSNSKSFRRSSWYGLGALVILYLIIVLAAGAKQG